MDFEWDWKRLKKKNRTLIEIDRDWNKLMKIKKIEDWLWYELVEIWKRMNGLWYELKRTKEIKGRRLK